MLYTVVKTNSRNKKDGFKKKKKTYVNQLILVGASFEKVNFLFELSNFLKLTFILELLLCSIILGKYR